MRANSRRSATPRVRSVVVFVVESYQFYIKAMGVRFKNGPSEFGDYNNILC